MLEHPGNFLRLYQWSKPTLSLGRFQALDGQIDLGFCESHSIDVVRRATGGQAVLHHQELTYSFASSTPPFPRSILESYQQVRQPILDGLNQLGYGVTTADGGKFKPASSVCFSVTQGHEVKVDSRKLVGSAQRRKAGRLLQHGSILLSYDLALCQGVWPGRDASVWEEEMIGLDQLGKGAVDVNQLCQSIGQNFASQFSAAITEKQWTSEEKHWVGDREQDFLLSKSFD